MYQNQVFSEASSSGGHRMTLRKSVKTLEFERVVSNINKGYKELVILRGLPGSGKSFLARKVIESTIGLDANYKLHVFSTDDYFHQNRRGEYEYDVRKLDDAHKWNKSRVYQAVSRGFSPVIIDNTNTQIWEMKPYVLIASEFGYEVNILEPDTHWCFNEEELTKRNTHGVDRAKIRDMMARYETNVTLRKLLSVCRVAKIHPQMRLYPPTHIQVSSASALTADSENRVDSLTRLKLYSKKDNDKTSSHSHIQNGSPQVLVNGYEENMELGSDDDNESQNSAVKELPDVEKLWGISYEGLRSWDIVTPIEDVVTNSNTTAHPDVARVVEKKDACVMTEYQYFYDSQRSELGANYGEIRILQTYNRNINFSMPNETPNRSNTSTLDKSCMTDDLHEDYNNHISQLVNLFPTVPRQHLTYWYNKCKKVLEWTIEFLLENNEVLSTCLEPEETTTSPSVSNSSIQHDSEVESPTIDRNEQVKKKLTENSDLKKLIESKIDIGEDHYSKNLLRIKKSKFSDQLAGCSKTLSFPNESASCYSDEISTQIDEEVIVIDSDIDSDESDSDDSENECNSTIEINLGDHLIAQLESTFGIPELQYPKGLQPVVQLPITMARQLYTCYIESVYQQMENQEQIMNTLTQEDEAFARKIQAKENEKLKPTSTSIPNLKEIMSDQQAAESLSRKERENWKKLDLDNLATKLSRQKLYKTFPSVPQDTLDEIFYAHHNKYQETIETLIASVGPDDLNSNLKTIREPPIESRLLEDMKEAQKNSNCVEDCENTREATYYREVANKHLSKRAELYQKAQRYHSKGMTEVAQFYSDIASSQTIYFERANSLAATAFLEEHSKRLQDFKVLDLHYLYVKEAIHTLDVFLDKNIQVLRLNNSKQYEFYEIITGRGNRSQGGVSRIKPAVRARLKERKIQCNIVNPGSLRVRLHKTTWVTSEMPVP